jgi:hypothetical protein
MLSVTDNSRGRAVIPPHVVSLRQIARLRAKYSVFSRHHTTAALESIRGQVEL